MSFRLEITFSGLCLLVPDTDPKLGEVIHVLMADAGEHMKHFPRLVYSRDYEVPADEESAPPVKKPEKGIVQNDEQVVELDGFPAIDLVTPLKGRIDAAAARFPLPEKILNVSDLAKASGVKPPGHQVAEKWFRGDLPKNGACLARITIPSAQLVAYNQILVDVPDSTGANVQTGVTGSACVTATFDVAEPPLFQFNAGSKLIPKLISLKPSAGVIKLLVGNMMDGEYHHPPVSPSMTMSHYPAYYDLLLAPPKNRPSPELAGAGRRAAGGVNPLICMLGDGCGEGDRC